MYRMRNKDMYGEVSVNSSVFKKLDSKYFISGCTDTIKFMCANKPERKHLNSLGIKTTICDWYKIICDDTQYYIMPNGESYIECIEKLIGRLDVDDAGLSDIEQELWQHCHNKHYHK